MSKKLLNVLTIVALIAAICLFLTKDSFFRYCCFATIFLVLGVHTTYEYVQMRYKQSFVFSIMFYLFFLSAIVFAAGTVLGVK